MTEKRGRNADALGWAAAIALALAVSFQKIVEADAGWNLAGGRLVLRGVFPTVNTFSHTFPNHPWEFTSWLFGLLMALAQAAFGDAGLTLLCMAFAAGFAALLTGAARRRHDFSWRFFLPVLALGLVGIHYRFQPRGDLASLVGLAAIPWLWAGRGRKLPLWAFLLGAVWTNMHAGVVFGLGVWAVFVAEAFIKGEKKDAKAAAIAFGAFFAGSLLSPTGTWSYFFGHAKIIAFLEDSVTEFQRVDPAAFPSIYLFWALGTIAALRAPFRRDYAFTALFAGYGLLSLMGARYAGYSVAVALPGVALHLGGMLKAAGKRGGLVIGAVLLAVGAAAVWVDISNDLRDETNGIGFSSRYNPVAAADFIEQAGIPGDFYNEFNFGGYLAGRFHPERRITIDGRCIAYPLAHFDRTALNPADFLGTLLTECQTADIAVLQRRGESMEAEAELARLGWKPVFIDATAAVFVRPGTQAERAGAAYELRVIRFWKGDDELFKAAWQDKPRALAELMALRERRFTDPHDFYRLAHASFVAGDRALAEEWYVRGMAENPKNRELKEQYERFKTMR